MERGRDRTEAEVACGDIAIASVSDWVSESGSWSVRVVECEKRKRFVDGMIYMPFEGGADMQREGPI